MFLLALLAAIEHGKATVALEVRLSLSTRCANVLQFFRAERFANWEPRGGLLRIQKLLEVRTLFHARRDSSWSHKIKWAVSFALYFVYDT